MSSIQFNTTVFTDGLVGDRLKLFNRMRRMSEHHSDALSLGIIDGQGHRIRFLNDLHPQSHESVAGQIRDAVDHNDFDKALQLVAEQIKKGEVVFEKHSKNDDKAITAFAKKEVLDRIKTMKLHDKKSGQDVGYSEVAELQQEQLQEIQEAADSILPQATHTKTEKAPATASTATKKEEAVKKQPIHEEKKRAESPAIVEDQQAAKETLKALQAAPLLQKDDEEKRDEEKKEEDEIQQKELQRTRLKEEVIKEEIEKSTLQQEATTEVESDEEPESEADSSTKEVP